MKLKTVQEIVTHRIIEEGDRFYAHGGMCSVYLEGIISKISAERDDAYDWDGFKQKSYETGKQIRWTSLRVHILFGSFKNGFGRDSLHYEERADKFDWDADKGMWNLGWIS